MRIWLGRLSPLTAGWVLVERWAMLFSGISGSLPESHAARQGDTARMKDLGGSLDADVCDKRQQQSFGDAIL